MIADCLRVRTNAAVGAAPRGCPGCASTPHPDAPAFVCHGGFVAAAGTGSHMGLPLPVRGVRRAVSALRAIARSFATPTR